MAESDLELISPQPLHNDPQGQYCLPVGTGEIGKSSYPIGVW